MKNMSRMFWAFVSCICLALPCRAVEQYKFRLIDVPDGLSDNQIRGLSMVPDGRVGIRTASILNIYDGASFEYFLYDKDRKYVWTYSRPPKEYYDGQDRVWMKELRYLLLLDLKTNTFNYDIQGELASMGIDKRLKNLFIDDAKNYWFLTEDNTFFFYDVRKQEKKVIDRGDSEFTRRYGVPLELAQYKNFCWIVYDSGLIRCWDYTSSEFLFQDSRFEGIINGYTDRLYLHPDSAGNLWLMYNNGICFYNRTLREWKDVACISGISNFFTCMDMDRDGNVWAGTSRSGLRRIDGKTFSVSEMPDMALTNGGRLHNDIYAVMADPRGGLWVGTLFQGLCYHHPGMQKFQLAQTCPGSSYITNESVRCFLEEEDGTILVGSGKGLFRFHPETHEVEQVFKDEINELVLSLSRDRQGNVWVGTFLKGFYQICGGGGCKHFLRSQGDSEQDVAQNVSRALYEDSHGNYWVSVNGGVGLLDPEDGTIEFMLHERHPELKNFKLILSLCPTGKDCFAALGDNGLFYYDAGKDEVRIPDTRKDKYYKSGIKYFGLLTDARGLQWFATEDGIRIWDKKTERLYLLTMSEGLPNNTVSSILEDCDGVVWASTLNGICKIIPREEGKGGYRFSVVAFGVPDGLQSGMFYDHAALKAKNGMLYFGGAHGFNYFNPGHMVCEEAANRPILTGLSIFNTPVRVGEEYEGHVVLSAPMTRTDKIELRYDENFISIAFSGLNYANPSHTYYKYRLKNYEEGWTETRAASLGRAVYTGLRPGTYEFEVYAANGDKVWSKEPARLSIVVHPPFWETYYAMAVYVLVAIGMVYWLSRMYVRREKEKMMEERRENARKQREHQEEMKLRFFTNVSHEFRTPLTLILTPLGTLIKQQGDVDLKQRLTVIYRNAEKLLQLVNQLLDFRKLEMRGERLSVSMGDMVVFVRDAVEAFRGLVKEKGITLTFESKVEHFYMNYDHDKVYKVVNNLLSNAVKFTPSGGCIGVGVESSVRNGREYVAVSVRDTGCGMEEGDKERIFTRFYQVEDGHKTQPGSGIGLHLVKGYVDLHGGEITVDSRPGEGSTFTVLLPADLQHDEKATVPHGEDKETVEASVLSAGEEDEEPSGGKKKLLVVEDNADFRAYLVHELSADFDVVEAGDGVEGEEMVREEWPDLVISDLMMPRRDGIAFCQRMKNDIHTSHIPFILLTAKMSDDARIESYKAGADSYISKPFNFELLQVRVRKLIEQREARKETFRKNIEITPSEITTTSLDEEFVKKALAFVEKNMGNAEYSLEDLSKDLGLSKTHLNRKLTVILNMKPLQFIRSVRLKRAAQLLAGSQYNVAEIADKVGFNTIKYFNRYFKEEFGMTPTQYREANKRENKSPKA